MRDAEWNVYVDWQQAEYLGKDSKFAWSSIIRGLHNEQLRYEIKPTGSAKRETISVLEGVPHKC